MTLNKYRGALADKSAAIQNISFSIGASIAPIIGGLLCDKFGYRHTFDIVALICITYSVIIFCIVFMPRLIKCSK
jgi:MFS family permease